MNSGQDITLEIGGRSLVVDGSFFMADADKVGLVGRNGAAKSSLIHFLLGESPTHMRASGDIRIEGTVGYLPQVPVPGGLGVDASALCHVLLARGLDVVDDRLHKTQAAMATSPTDESIHEYAELEEQYRAAGDTRWRVRSPGWPMASPCPRHCSSKTCPLCDGLRASQPPSLCFR